MQKAFGERGEVATLLTIAAMIVVGVSVFITSLTTNQNRQTTSTQAVGIPCSRYPVIPPPDTPPANYYWEADCNRWCDRNSMCPQNVGNPDSGFVNASTSNLCYTHFGGEVIADNRCMMLRYEPVVPRNSTPTPQVPTQGPTGALNCNTGVSNTYFDGNLCVVDATDTNQIGCYVRSSTNTSRVEGCAYQNTQEVGSGRFFIQFNCADAANRLSQNFDQVGGLKYTACSNDYSRADWRSRYNNPVPINNTPIPPTPVPPTPTSIPRGGGEPPTPTATPTPTNTSTQTSSNPQCPGGNNSGYMILSDRQCYYCPGSGGRGVGPYPATYCASPAPIICASETGCRQLSDNNYYQCNFPGQQNPSRCTPTTAPANNTPPSSTTNSTPTPIRTPTAQPTAAVGSAGGSCLSSTYPISAYYCNNSNLVCNTANLRCEYRTGVIGGSCIEQVIPATGQTTKYCNEGVCGQNNICTSGRPEQVSGLARVITNNSCNLSHISYIDVRDVTNDPAGRILTSRAFSASTPQTNVSTIFSFRVNKFTGIRKIKATGYIRYGGFTYPGSSVTHDFNSVNPQPLNIQISFTNCP